MRWTITKSTKHFIFSVNWVQTKVQYIFIQFYGLLWNHYKNIYIVEITDIYCSVNVCIYVGINAQIRANTISKNIYAYTFRCEHIEYVKYKSAISDLLLFVKCFELWCQHRMIISPYFRKIKIFFFFSFPHS